MKIKKIDIYERSKTIGTYVVEKNATVRQAAKIFGVSKSTIHKDLTDRLPEEDQRLYKQVRKVLDTNKQQRAARGGEATKKKYLQKKKITTK